MVIGSTMFNHKNIHKMTWKSPDGNSFNQINHLIIYARYLSHFMDVRTYRVANIDSDHYLAISKIRSRIPSAKKVFGFHARKFNSEGQKEPEVEAGCVERLTEYLKSLTGCASVSGVWKVVKDFI
jgi:hypothetical protein